MTTKTNRPHIPKHIQIHLWLRAGGRCEFRGCNRILYEDNVTQDPINGSNIAHIISWTETGPRGDRELSSKLAIDINNLMLTCPEHNHLIDSGEFLDRYTVSYLQEMKQEHENSIRELTGLNNQLPKRVIELRSMVHGQRPSITEKEEVDALLPFYPKGKKIVIDLCDIDNYNTAKVIIDSKVEQLELLEDGSELYAVFIMALIPYACYLGYSIGNKVPVQSFQHFRDTEDWKWRRQGKGQGDSFSISFPDTNEHHSDVNLFINISGEIDFNLVSGNYPVYSISAICPGFCFLQSWEQVQEFRKLFREMLDKIRHDHGESVIIHLYPATPNPISFEIGKGIMKNLDPTIILYDKTDDGIEYKEVMHLHNRIR